MVEQGSFILSGEDQVNEYISSQIGYIVERILSVIKPISIVLYGSLGKGEGTIYHKGSCFSLASDVEIGIVSRNFFKLPAIRTLRRELANNRDVDVTLSFFLPRRFTRKVASNWALPSSYLTLEQYELMTGMRVLHGIDLRPKRINISPSEIMPWDALRLIFNRTAELLGSLTETPFHNEHVIKQSQKLLIACGDAILLLTDHYHYSYLKRSQILRELVLTPSANNLPLDVKWEYVLDAYSLKLNSTTETIPTSLLLETINNRVLVPTLRFCTQKLLGWSFQGISEFCLNYLKSPFLINFSRSFSGSPALQTLLLNIKQYGSYHGRVNKVYSWRDVHEVYAESVLILDSISGNDLRIEELETFLSSESRTQITSLVDKWQQLCDIL